MTGHRITIPRGWRLDKAGKLVKCTKHLDVRARVRQRGIEARPRRARH